MSPTTPTSDRSRMRILCVEDNSPDFELVQEYLGLAPGAPPFELLRASRVSEAKELLLSAKGEGGDGGNFDIVLSDLSLPDSKGEDTFLTIQKADPDVAIAVMTGLEDDRLGLKLVKMGAQDFLPKDQFNPTFLWRTILHAIERKRNQVEMERLHADLKAAQRQLIQAEKLESLGRLSAGVAHEIKNPLAILQACVDFYSARDTTDEAESTIRTMMQEAIDRATRIVGGMLDFSREEKLERKSADTNALVLQAVRLAAQDLKTSGIQLVEDFDENLPHANLDANKIERVILNLLTNAIHASDEGGRIEIRTYPGEISDLIRDEGQRDFEHLRVGDDVVVVEIRDYGSGIPEQKITKIFDPFFTTKATGKGTGLGLSISKTIVSLHGGMLRIRNVEPTGIRAQMILPVLI